MPVQRRVVARTMVGADLRFRAHVWRIRQALTPYPPNGGDECRSFSRVQGWNEALP
jgi:hypothetical protein